MIRLTKEQIQGVLDAQDGDHYCDCEDIAKAQLKQVVEWRNQECTEHSHTINISGVDHKMIVMHNNCERCWQALLEEVKE